MKVIPRKNVRATIMQVPPIPYKRKEKKKLAQDERLTLKLRTDPANQDSQEYELTVAIFSSGTPEEWLVFLKNLNKTMVGMNITNGPAKYTMARRLMEGEALANFNIAATTNGNETNANFELCLKAVTRKVFPQQALLKQKDHVVASFPRGVFGHDGREAV